MYSACTFGGLSHSLAFGRTRTLADIMREHGQLCLQSLIIGTCLMCTFTRNHLLRVRAKLI